jgi:TPR repeat protein
MTPAQRTSMVRGDRYLNQGDIAAARLIYHSLARQNIAEAALAMARTYDPEILTALAVQGLRPDIGEAKVWYEKAKELGSEPAAQRLATLDALGY